MKLVVGLGRRLADNASLSSAGVSGDVEKEDEGGGKVALVANGLAPFVFEAAPGQGGRSVLMGEIGRAHV